MSLYENAVPAKRRLENISRLLFQVSPVLFDSIDRFFNIARYIDLENLKPFLKKSYGSVLEIGCGKGYFVAPFVQRGGRYYGVDIEIEELIFLKRYHHRNTIKNSCRVVAGRGEKLPFADNSFDLVFCNCVIEHILDDEAVLRESARVLKPGGDMIFTFPTSTYEPRFLKRMLFQRRSLRWLADPSLLHYFDFPTIQEAEDWYVCEHWYHVRRGYAFDEVSTRLAGFGMQVSSHFYFYTYPLTAIWELCSFSRLNALFPLPLLLFAPFVRLMDVSRHGGEKDSQLFAIKAVLK